jgi:phosphatidate cytidylyltransferase
MLIEFKKRIITSIFLFSLLILMYFYTFILIISLIIISVITWVEFYAIISKIFLTKDIKDYTLRVIFKAISLLYLSMIVFLIVYYHNTDSYIFIAYSLLIAVASDVGGIIVGKTFKGKKLTQISPKKTISGSVGSFAFSLILVPLFYSNLYIDNYLILSLITLIISLTSQLGDLSVSALKRKANVKNTSDLLPGHGGFLDRIDGIIFAIPVGFIIFKFI